VLDFACGTGTFLLEAMQIALDGKSESTKQDYIRNKILPNFFGFEYLVAPYTVAHLKLSQYLKDNGFEMSGNERLGVYLTDTLDDQKPIENTLYPRMSGEGKEANIIKTEKPIWVVMGNPPYSNYSRNNKGFILELIKEYKKNLNEKKLNLNDDYIKFLRFAQCKIEGTTYSYEKTDKTGQGDKKSANIEGHLKGNGCGIVGVITNNSYLDGITHRQMRNSLLGTFDKVYIVNLHGSTLKGEADQNVFDIMTGVSIVLFVKLPKSPAKKEVLYYSTLEQGYISREKKYEFLNKNSIGTIGELFKPLTPTQPDWWFVEKDRSLEAGYKEWKGLTDIFNTWGSGIKTDRDELFCDFNKNHLTNRIEKLLSNKYDADFIEIYNVKDSGSYKLLSRLNRIFNEKNIHRIDYRPFDKRNIYYEVGLTSRPAFDVMQHFLIGENVGLSFSRQLISDRYQHILVNDKITECCYVSIKSREFTYTAPLYLYEHQLQQAGSTVAEYVKVPNFKQDFLTFLKEKYNHEFTPEQILGYIYAVLHCPTYRKKYFEFLKVDFPRIPFLDRHYFDQLSKLGQELIDHHLLKIHYPQKQLSHLEPSGSNKIEKPEWVDGKMKINSNQYFTGISKEVWEFEIGGYKVLQHYLKDRKGRAIDYDEEHHIGKTARSLEETIRLMKTIDNIIGDII
jgi:predicted helicase